MVHQHGLGLGYVPVPDDAVKPPKAPAMRFRDWLITHNWSLHRAGLFVLALSCLVRSFTRGDAAVDGLDVVISGSLAHPARGHASFVRNVPHGARVF